MLDAAKRYLAASRLPHYSRHNSIVCKGLRRGSEIGSEFSKHYLIFLGNPVNNANSGHFGSIRKPLVPKDLRQVSS